MNTHTQGALFALGFIGAALAGVIYWINLEERHYR